MKAGNIEYKAIDLPKNIPLLVENSTFLLPSTYIPLIVHTSEYIKLIEDAIKGNRLVGVIQKNPDNDNLYNIGCIARITSFSELGNGKMSIALDGICRFKLLNAISTKPYLFYNISAITEDLSIGCKIPKNYKKQIEKIIKLLAANSMQIEINSLLEHPFEILINSLCVSAELTSKEQQILLEANSSEERMYILLALCERKQQVGDKLQ